MDSLVGEWKIGAACGADTSGQKDLPEPEEQLMSKASAAQFRRGAAQLNYLSQDRPVLSFASKEVAKHVANPRVDAEAFLRRAVRHLRAHPRWVATYEWRDTPGGLVAYTDSDCGGRVQARRSTSGGGDSAREAPGAALEPRAATRRSLECRGRAQREHTGGTGGARTAKPLC